MAVSSTAAVIIREQAPETPASRASLPVDGKSARALTASDTLGRVPSVPARPTPASPLTRGLTTPPILKHPVKLNDAVQSEVLYNDIVAYQGGGGLRGRAHGLPFTPAQIRAINKALVAMRPLLQCDGTPVNTMQRVDKLIQHGAVRSSTMAEYEDRYGTITFGNSARGKFMENILHELAHATMQYQDPRSCKRYRNPFENPFVKEWIVKTGWEQSAPKSFTPGVATSASGAWEFPPERARGDDYAATNPLEDMAVSFALYMTDRDKFRRESSVRAGLYDNLYAQLGLAPPEPVSRAAIADAH